MHILSSGVYVRTWEAYLRFVEVVVLSTVLQSSILTSQQFISPHSSAPLHPRISTQIIYQSL